ncbi:MAG: acyl carrier protein [Desulfuromonas sp.]|nr:acyl carrier protein [Desulfuromonas sp.]
MMTDAELTTLIFALLEENAPGCEPEQLQGDDNMREELELDSFDYLNFLIALSEQLQVDIPEADYEKIQSLNTLLAYLQDKP